MKLRKHLSAILAAGLLMLSAVACSSDDPAEEASDAASDATEEVSEAASDASEEVSEATESES